MKIVRITGDQCATTASALVKTHPGASAPLLGGALPYTPSVHHLNWR
jgi:hypothetical protein